MLAVQTDDEKPPELDGAPYRANTLGIPAAVVIGGSGVGML